jgi:hypothetical protein
MDHGSDILLRDQKAKEILRNIKNRWGVTWPEMGKFLNWQPSSLRVYASRGKYSPQMPYDLIDIILQLEHAPNPILDKGHSSDIALVIRNGNVHLLKLNLRTCLYCGKPFSPQHPQQLYCDTYSGKCGLAMRRKRRMDDEK